MNQWGEGKNPLPDDLITCANLIAGKIRSLRRFPYASGKFVLEEINSIVTNSFPEMPCLVSHLSGDGCEC